MKDLTLIARLLETPWALSREMLATMTRIVARHALGGVPTPDVVADVQAAQEARAARKEAAARAGGGTIAVLSLMGTMVHRGAQVDSVSSGGLVSTERVAQALRAAIADETIAGVLIDIDSPGGSVFGTGELADEIIRARAQKPVYAIANSMAASAAYWAGSQASKLFVTPGGMVGSIGVYMAHEDWSKALDEAGIKVSYVQAGEYKTEGNPTQPLSDEARAHLQATVDTYYAAFTKGVAKGRGVPISQVRDGMGKGRVLTADDALAAQMVDGIATFDEALAQLAKDIRSSRQPAARAAARARDIEINGA